jgi:ferredoxin
MRKVILNIPDVLGRFERIVFFSALLFLFLQAPPPSLAETGEKKALEIGGSMFLETISRESGIPAAYLVEGLKLYKDIPLNVPLKNLKEQYGFSIETKRKLVADYEASIKPVHVIAASWVRGKGGGRDYEKRGEVSLPLILYGILCFSVLPLLRAKTLSNRLAIWILVPSLLIFGVLFRANPEPMRAFVHVFQSLALGRYSLPATILVFLAFALMTFIGVKLVCGWACPVGTLQEILYRLPVSNKIKKKRVPFWFSNSVRVAIFSFFLIFVFGFISGLQDQSLYRYFNPFRLFEWNFRVTAPLFVILIFGLSLFNYRSYCMFVCPFGLFSWLIQNLSVFRVKVNRDSCIDCGKCGRACPTGAAEGILLGKTFKADCFSCARCLNACPNDSLGYRAF